MNNPTTALTAIRYVLSEVLSNGTEMDWWRHRTIARLNGFVQTRLYPRRQGIAVPQQDWETLVVLDACRPNLFEETIGRDRFDAYLRVRSKASSTREWLLHAWPDEYGEIVYVAGNPMVSDVRPRAWHALVEPWREARDPDAGLIRPEPVVAAARRAREQYPNKRLVVHLMQPHVPFVDPDLQYCSYNQFDVDVEGQNAAATVWHAAAKGLIDRDELWEAYAETLAYGWDAIAGWLRSCKGRTVVTSDHGNVVRGRSWPVPFGYSQHLPNQRHPELTTVPWAVIDKSRRDTSGGGVGSDTDADSTTTKERLAALGYT